MCPHQTARPALGRQERRGEGGEGVVSAAIAVLVMAFLGVAMYLAFAQILDRSSERVEDQVDCIGRSAPAGQCAPAP